MWESAVTREQLRHSITRLAQLNNVPELPQENTLAPNIDTKRCLSVQRENEIVGNLAFLSAISDDSQKVMAVCIEEHPRGEGSTIRITSNSGDLSMVTSGFKMLATILERAARRANPRSEDLEALFQQILVLDLHRILSRLRSRHAKKSRKTNGKPALITQLNQVINHKSVEARSGIARRRWTASRDAARALEILFFRLEHILNPHSKEVDMQKIIGEIVKGAYELTRESHLSAALQNFSGDPSLKTHLPEAIGKLARYYAAASELLCAARDRKCRIFQTIEVESYEMLTPSNIREGFEKVHAEIKLLFYYELHPDRPRPRIICSSKSACYLCNLFFRFHKGFSIPRTHGRLYEKWVLPDWLDVPVERWRDLGITVSSLEASLETKIQSALRSKKRYLHPNESVLAPFAHWPSSSALSRDRLSTGPASTSTTLPQSQVSQQEMCSKLSLGAEIPLTRPGIPLESPHHTSVSRHALTAGPFDHDYGKDALAVDAVSLVTIRSSDLPYCQSIKVTTPSLHVQLDEMFLILEFVQVFSGQLSITQAVDTGVCRKGHHLVDIKNIPITTELQLECLDSSNQLSFQLQSDGKRSVCFFFVWDDPFPGEKRFSENSADVQSSFEHNVKGRVVGMKN